MRPSISTLRTAGVRALTSLRAHSNFATGLRRRVPSRREVVNINFRARIAGDGGQRMDHIWLGPFAGPVSGEVTMWVDHLGAEADRARGGWPVRALVFVRMDDASRSFLAELEGTIEWSTGTMRLAGRISQGWQAGASVAHTLHLDPPTYDGVGTLRIWPLTARR